ncbi:MAG TPA: dephospho-CoA kinase [Vicinamibacterales bacterium]|nr:dephospho-CoA kinase [Vicinamibacterales bacterium]
MTPGARPLHVALTGGIATGKSVCLKRFAELGAATIDADDVARDVVEPGTPELDAIVARFGPDIVRPDGALDRPALARIAFTQEAARRDLEAIVHPAVYTRIRDWLAVQTGRVAVADIPLLYETGHADAFDSVVVAACRPDQQLVRLMARDRLDGPSARARLAAQWPIGEKAALADYVVDTSGTIAETRARVEDVWSALLAAPFGHNRR